MFKEKDKLTNKFNSSIIIFERQRSKYLFHIRIKFKKKLLSIFDNKKKKNKPLFPKTKKKKMAFLVLAGFQNDFNMPQPPK